jgi:hypothetical protein
LWEEGAKRPEGKSSCQKIEAKELNLEMLCPGIPEKAVKSFSARNRGTHKNNKTTPS